MSELQKEELQELIPALTDEELEQAAGGGCGHICTFTLDCRHTTRGCRCFMP